MVQRAGPARIAALLLACGLACARSDPGGCPSDGCTPPPPITSPGSPSAAISAPRFDRFYRGGAPIEVRVDASGTIRSLDVVLDGQVVGCDMSSGKVVRHFGGPPFVGAIDTSSLAPGLHRLDVVARDSEMPPRCDSDHRTFYLDRPLDTDVTEAAIAPDGGSIAFSSAPGGVEPGLHWVSARGDRSRFLMDGVAAGSVRFGGSILGFLAGGEGQPSLYLDRGLRPELLDRDVRDFLLAPDGGAVAWVRGDGQVRLRRLDSPGAPAVRSLGAGADRVELIERGDSVLTSTPSGDGLATVSVYDSRSGDPLVSVGGVRRVWTGSPDWVLVEVQGAGGGLLQAIPVRGGGRADLLASGGDFSPVGFSSDGATVVFVVDGDLHLFRLRGAGLEAESTPLAAPVPGVVAARISPGGALVALVRSEPRAGQSLSLWEVPGPRLPPPAPAVWLQGGSFDAGGIRFSPSGRAAAYLAGGRLWLWRSGVSGAPLVADQAVLDDVVFSPRGALLAYRTSDVEGAGAALNVLEVATGLVATVPARGPVERYLWSPDGAALMTQGGAGVPCEGECRGPVSVWSRAGGPTFMEARAVASAARAIAFSPDGGFVLAVGAAAGSDEQTLIVTRAY